MNVSEVGLKDSKRVQLGNIVTAHLICANKKLHLQDGMSGDDLSPDKTHLEMIVKFCTAGNMEGRRAISGVGQIGGRGLKRLGTRQALIEAGEIDVP